MHLPEEHLFDAVYGMRRVLRPGGRLLLSIPARRTDVDAKTRRDPHGRYFADLPPGKLRLLLERVGFRLLWERETTDAQGRPDTAWATFLFEKPRADSDRPLDRVESILNRDKKDATYKLALFRALAEIAQTQYNVARYDQPGHVGIPIQILAEKWLAYYWPIVDSDTFIAQKHGERPGAAKPMAIRRPVQAVIDAFGEAGGLPAFLVALKNGDLPPSVQDVYQGAIRKIASTIWNMPVRYAGGGEEFSVFGYDKKTRMVLLPEELWRELSLTGSWILDATVLRWAELTERLSKGAVSVSLIVEKLLSISDPERETGDARALYQRIGVGECVWTGKPLRSRFDVDHAIPFALWRNNDLWNLLPADPAENNAKRDRLPTQHLLRKRRDVVIGYWEALRENFEERFEREAAALCGVTRLRSGDWQAPLFGRFAEAVEVTAVQRCVPRWEPADSGNARARSAVVGTRQGGIPTPRRAPHSPTVPESSRSGAGMPTLWAYADIREEVFKRYLPVVGALAAGAPYSGFDTVGLEAADDCPWVAVPERLAGRKRFIIQIAGDSMEPDLNVGDWVIFEYHRSPRATGQVVIANVEDLGQSSDWSTVHAVKRLEADEECWIFRSTNPLYEDIRVPRADCAYPILGIMVQRL